MEFEAKTASLNDDGYCTVLALASDAIDPKHFAILQITNQPTRQDVDLGHGGIHFELGGSKLSGYNLISSIEARGNEVLLTFDQTAAQKADADAYLTIRVSEPHINGKTVPEAIALFQARLRRN